MRGRRPERTPERDRWRDERRGRGERSGHRREYDGRQERRTFAARVDGVVRDVGAFSGGGAADLVERQFDGHPFVALRGLALAERRGWVRRRKARGPQGGECTVVVATPAGAARAATSWCEAGRPEQRTFSGAVKPSEIGHDVAVYRAAGVAQSRIESAGGRVVRVRIDAELKGRLAARAERARRQAGQRAADLERCRVAAALGLPVETGQVLVPDAQVEYVDAAGRTGRCNVEVASEHYRGRSIRAKARAGFVLCAPTARAAKAIRRALGDGNDGRRGGYPMREEPEVIEL